MGVDPGRSATVVSVMVTLSVVRRLIRATGSQHPVVLADLAVELLPAEHADHTYGLPLFSSKVHDQLDAKITVTN